MGHGESIPPVGETDSVRRGAPVRVGKTRYLSPEVHASECEQLWPNIWQIACRADDVAGPGDYIEYTIVDQSILVLRDHDGDIRAFHNVCQHRGNLLAPGTGSAAKLVCGFHCWTWNLDGTLFRVPYEDRVGQIDRERYQLKPVRVGQWAGFVFVCMADDAPALLDWLAPLPDQLAAYHMDEFTRTQDYSFVVRANWKTVVDAFNESYHIMGVHPQTLPFIDDTRTFYQCFESHSRMLIPVGQPSDLAKDASQRDIFASMVRNASGTDTEMGRLDDPAAFVDALASMKLPAGQTVRGWLVKMQRAEATAHGVDLSKLSDDQVAADWHYQIFPNAVLNIYGGNFWYFRMRPHGGDPDQMRFDFQDYHWITDADEARGRKAEHRWVDVENHSFGEVLDQDFALLPRIQRGMHSKGFSELTLSTMEQRIQHFHRVLDRYIGRDQHHS